MCSCKKQQQCRKLTEIPHGKLSSFLHQKKKEEKGKKIAARQGLKCISSWRKYTKFVAVVRKKKMNKYKIWFFLPAPENFHSL